MQWWYDINAPGDDRHDNVLKVDSRVSSCVSFIECLPSINFSFPASRPPI